MIPNLRYEGPLDGPNLVECLAMTGLSPAACRERASLLAQTFAALGRDLGARPGAELGAFFVPGRIEVLGKHTDYAGGRSLVASAERGFCLAVVPGEDRRVRVCDVSLGESVEFDLDPDLRPTVGHWSNYPMTVARRLARNFPTARLGATIALASDLPAAAGMSSSSALMVAVFAALNHVNQVTASRAFRDNAASLTDLAGYLGTVENGQTFGSLEGDRGVGTFGGSEDHTAMLCAQPEKLCQYAYCPVRFEQALPVPEGYTFAIGTSGVLAEKTGQAMEKYNRASRLVAEIQRRWAQHTGRCETLAAAIASGPNAPEELRAMLQASGGPFSSEDLLTRLEHFFVENEQVIPQAGQALACGDVIGFGLAVDRSQGAAEELLGNQVPETSALARAARQSGAVAASAFGAGFGGSVWALVETGRIEPFLQSWAERYRQAFPAAADRARFFATAAGPAAFQVC